MSRSGERWTKEDVEFVKKSYGVLPTKQVVKHLKRSIYSIYGKAYELGLGGRAEHFRGYGYHKYCQAKKQKSEQALIQFLRNQPKHRYEGIRKIKKYVSNAAYRQLKYKRRIHVVTISLARSTGSFKRDGIQYELFNRDYYGKTFVCLDRTAVVRLMIDACKAPQNEVQQRILSHYLAKNLSEAEKFAVLWNLGIHHFDRSGVKSTIQIDGVIMPRRKSQ